MVARVKIQSPPAVAIDWRYFWYCVRDTWAKRFDMKKALPGLANSTLDNVWHGRPVGLIPFLRICKRMKMDPFKFLVERLPRRRAQRGGVSDERSEERRGGTECVRTC